MFHNERDVFHVSLGGFDLHTNMIDGMVDLMGQVDSAINSFELELKSMGLWDSVTIVQYVDLFYYFCAYY